MTGNHPRPGLPAEAVAQEEACRDHWPRDADLQALIDAGRSASTRPNFVVVNGRPTGAIGGAGLGRPYKLGHGARSQANRTPSSSWAGEPNPAALTYGPFRRHAL